MRKKFSQKCKVEFVDNLDTKVEVKATTFKPSRTKEKQELRKMIEREEYSQQILRKRNEEAWEK